MIKVALVFSDLQFVFVNKKIHFLAKIEEIRFFQLLGTFMQSQFLKLTAKKFPKNIYSFDCYSEDIFILKLSILTFFLIDIFKKLKTKILIFTKLVLRKSNIFDPQLKFVLRKEKY